MIAPGSPSEGRELCAVDGCRPTSCGWHMIADVYLFTGVEQSTSTCLYTLADSLPSRVEDVLVQVELERPLS